MSLPVMAQEKTKQREVGITFSSFSRFGLIYKTGTNKALWRYNTLLISGSNYKQSEDSLDRTGNNSGFKLSFGREYRKIVAENLELRYGLDVSFSYYYSGSKTDDYSVDNHDRRYNSDSYEPGVNLVFGLNYVISKNLVVGAEILPSLSYNFGSDSHKYYYNDKEIKSSFHAFEYGLSNTSALLSIAYRF